MSEIAKFSNETRASIATLKSLDVYNPARQFVGVAFLLVNGMGSKFAKSLNLSLKYVQSSKFERKF